MILSIYTLSVYSRGVPVIEIRAKKYWLVHETFSGATVAFPNNGAPGVHGAAAEITKLGGNVSGAPCSHFTSHTSKWVVTENWSIAGPHRTWK